MWFWGLQLKESEIAHGLTEGWDTNFVNLEPSMSVLKKYCYMENLKLQQTLAVFSHQEKLKVLHLSKSV